LAADSGYYVKLAFGCHRTWVIDVLVNNHNPVFDVTDDEWEDVFGLNVRALWKASIAVGAYMREKGSGSIAITSSSQDGKRATSAACGGLGYRPEHGPAVAGKANLIAGWQPCSQAGQQGAGP
jgi:NAD(P)-dependent dehydrogenase (short-subunit alcohol dehydrogenase family)